MVFFGRPVLVRRRPLLRAAVVGGGAYMAGKTAARNQTARAEQMSQQQAVPAQVAAGSSTFDQLNRLTTMHAQGALTDAEFAAAKAKLLGI